METEKNETENTGNLPSAPVIDPAEVQRRLDARPERCTDDCPGFDAFETDRGPEVQRCDECAAINPRYLIADLNDDDVAQLPAAQRALEKLKAERCLERGYDTLPDTYRLITSPWSAMTTSEQDRFVETWTNPHDTMDIAHVDSADVMEWLDGYPMALEIATLGKVTPGQLHGDGRRLVIAKRFSDLNHIKPADLSNPSSWKVIAPADVSCVYLLHASSRDPKLDPSAPGTYFDAYTQAVHQKGYASPEAIAAFEAWATIRFVDPGDVAIAMNGREGYTPRPIADRRPITEIYPDPTAPKADPPSKRTRARRKK